MVKFLFNEGVKPREIHLRLVRQYDRNTFSLCAVYQWICAFKKRRASCRDLPRPGRPVSEFNDCNVSKVERMIDQDRRLSNSYICRASGLSRGNVQRIIINQKLNLTKRCARWVPHHLENEHKQNRLQICTEILAH